MTETPKLVEFNRHKIITDDEFINTPADFNIEAFLKRYNSFLSGYSCLIGDNTPKTAIEAIKEAGEYVSERVIVVQLEKEMGLIRMQSIPSANRLKWAMGYGVDDGAPAEWLCSTTGVYKQIVSAAKSMRKRFDETAEDFIGKNIYEDFISKYDKVKDDIVKPENKATVCLYAYTPWVGERDQIIGKFKYTAPFGNKLFWEIWQKFFCM